MAKYIKEQLELILPTPELKKTKLMDVEEIYKNIENIEIGELKEDRRVERKVFGVQARSLGDYFSMFSNTPPDGGIILVGVEDDGSITGCVAADTKHINELERAGEVYCPEARYSSKFVKVINREGRTDKILVFHVRYCDDRVVETSAGVAFTRRGASKRRLSEDDKQELKNSKGQLDLESESVPLDFPDDFKQPLINQFVAAFRESRRLPPTKTAEEILVLRNLGRIVRGQFVPNVACALLFAKNPRTVFPGCRIRFLRFDGVLAHLIQRMAGIRWRVSRRLLILFRDWVSRPALAQDQAEPHPPCSTIR